MKRLLTIGLMLSAAFALTNCVDQFETPIQENDIVSEESLIPQEDGASYEVFVETAETKLNYNGNNYYWENGKDQISLYSLVKSGTTQSLQYHSDFTYIGGGKFVGKLATDLKDLPAESDWYSIFPCSSSSTTDKLPVTIGADEAANYTQVQTSVNNKRHLVGKGYPMYGVKRNVPKNKSPKFSMTHLSAIIALEIVNNGAGEDIVIRNAQFESTEEDIAGEFTVNLLGNSDSDFAPIYTPVTKKTSKVARIELTNPASIEYGESEIIYLAVKPFKVSSEDKLKIYVNGSYRELTVPANTKFEAGTVTTFRVPVNPLPDKGYALTSNAIGSKHITLSHTSPTSIIVNGSPVDAYILGTESETGYVKVEGYASELMAKLPVEFYAASYNNSQAVMRVENISVLGSINLPYSLVCEFIKDATKRQFKGILPLDGLYEKSKNLIILDEEPIHKRIDRNNIEGLLQEKFGADCTFEGIEQALADPSQINVNGTPANITATKIYNALDAKFKKQSIGMKIAWAGISFGSAYGLFNNASNIKIGVTLQSVKKDTGEDGYKATDNRVVVWGFNLNADK